MNTLDSEAEASRGTRKRDSAPPSPGFDRQLRPDDRLNATARLIWLLCALSHRYGFANMSVARMASELRVSSRTTIDTGLNRVRALGLFTREGRSGPERAKKYRRV